MITNFEQITADLNEYELSLVPAFINGFKHHSKQNPIKAPEILRKMKERGYKVSDARLRKIVNYMRSKSILPVIATSQGYYTSFDPDEIRKQAKSLQERASAIESCANGMLAFLPENV